MNIFSLPMTYGEPGPNIRIVNLVYFCCMLSSG